MVTRGAAMRSDRRRRGRKGPVEAKDVRMTVDHAALAAGDDCLVCTEWESYRLPRDGKTRRPRFWMMWGKNRVALCPMVRRCAVVVTRCSFLKTSDQMALLRGNPSPNMPVDPVSVTLVFVSLMAAKYWS